jgi:hypothetical protein
MTAALDLASLTNGRFGVIDVACPLCGPERRHAINRRRKVLRIWRLDSSFGTYHCARCGARGWERDGRVDVSAAKFAKIKTEAAARDADYAEERRRRARWMWGKSRPAPGTIAEVSLRSRGITVPIPATIRFLPPSKPEHYPVMIAPYGLADEPEPGVLAIAAETPFGVDARVRWILNPPRRSFKLRVLVDRQRTSGQDAALVNGPPRVPR